MRNLSKISSIGIPAIVGLGVAWLGVRIINSEESLIARKMELEIQAGCKSLKRFQ